MKRIILLTLFITILTGYSVSAAIHLPPSLTSPEDITYVVGTTGNEISWTAEADESGDSPGVYIVARNLQILPDHNEVAWEDNVPIVVNIDGLDVGDYSYQIEVRDSGYPDNADAATDQVEVSVVEESTQNGQTTPTNTEDTSFLPLLLGSLIAIPIFLIRNRN